MIHLVGKGFVNLDEHGDVILYNGTHNTVPAASTKVVSVFHQLHCLVSPSVSLSTTPITSAYVFNINIQK